MDSDDDDTRLVDPDRTRQTTLATPTMSTSADDADRTILSGTGRPAAAAPHAPALAIGTRLHEYRIDRVLGQGGFGITYLATDVHLNAQVAIKEYLPDGITWRSPTGQVGPAEPAQLARYRQGLESFLVEARTLAALRHPAIVRVARFFEAAGTAYMVLDHVRGEPFKTWWPRHRHIGEAGLIELMLPLLEGLAVVHQAGFLHRDIKPDNIQVRADDGRLVLLDFGSAAQVAAMGSSGAVMLTPGYAPIEQYGHGAQGPWTDLYALAATLYWAATGKRVPDAESRVAHPARWVPAGSPKAQSWMAALGTAHGQAYLQALDWALNTDPQQRPRDISAFRHALCADHMARLDLQQALRQGSGQDTGADDPASAQASGTGRWAAWGRQLRAALAPRDWPLALKLALLLVTTAVLPMLLTGWWNLRGGTDALARAELENVEQMARGTAGRVGQFIDEARHAARGLATDEAFATFLAKPDEAAVPALQQRLSRLVKADPDLQLIILMDPQGKALASNDPAVTGRSFAFRRYFREASAGRSYTSGIVVGAVAGASGFFVSEPVRGADGQQVGVLVLRVLASAVARIIDQSGHQAASTLFLVDGDGVVLHHANADWVFKSLAPLSAQQQAEIKADQRFRRERVESLNEPELARLVMSTSAGHGNYRSMAAGRDEIAGHAPVPGHDWRVAVSESRHTFEAPMRALFVQLLWSLLLVGALFTVLALWVARGLVRPIRSLTEATDALKSGDYDAARVKVGSRDELGQLGRTFNVMIEVLRQRELERRLDR